MTERERVAARVEMIRDMVLTPGPIEVGGSWLRETGEMLAALLAASSRRLPEPAACSDPDCEWCDESAPGREQGEPDGERCSHGNLVICWSCLADRQSRTDAPPAPGEQP